MFRSGNDRRGRKERARQFGLQAAAGRFSGIALAVCLLLASSVVSAQTVLRLPIHLSVFAASFLSLPAPPGLLPAPVGPANPPTQKHSVVEPAPSASLRVPSMEGRDVGRLDDLPRLPVRTHQVRVGPDGRLSGRVRTFDREGRMHPVVDDEVMMLREGSVVAMDTTGAAGRFEVSGLTSGVHALIVRSQETVLAYAIDVHQLTKDDRMDPKHPPVGELTLDSLAVPPDAARAVLSWIDSSSFAVPSKPLPIERHVRDLHEIALVDTSPAVPGTSLQTHPVVLRPDGRLLGRICRLDPLTGQLQPAANSLVAMFHEGVVIRTTRTNDQGAFALTDVLPGCYSLVVTTVNDHAQPHPSPDRDGSLVATARNDATVPGFAALGIEVVSASADEYRMIVPSRYEASAEWLAIDVALVDLSGFLQFTRLDQSAALGEALNFGAGSDATPQGAARGPNAAPGGAARNFPGVVTGPTGGGVPFVFPLIDETGSGSGVVCPFTP